MISSIKKMLLGCCLALSFAIHAETVVMGGLVGRPPIAYQHEALGLQGAALDIMAQILHELDIPYVSQSYESASQLRWAFEQKKVDVLLGISRNAPWHHALIWLEPALTSDRLSLWSRQGRCLSYGDPNAYAGYAGIFLESHLHRDRLEEGLQERLYLKPSFDVEKTLKALASRQVDYVIGSDMILQQWAALPFFDGQITPCITLEADIPLWIAVREDAEIAAYLPFIKEKLRALQESGFIEQTLSRHALAWANLQNALL